MMYMAIPWHSIELLALYTFAYAITIIAGCYVVAFILSKFPEAGEGGLKHAGLAIGILERIFVLTLVLYGQFTAIILVLAAKSIARFEDLKKREFAEYYLIGTFSSMLFALFVGLATVWLLAQL
jgi:Na+/serine symporter